MYQFHSLLAFIQRSNQGGFKQKRKEKKTSRNKPGALRINGIRGMGSLHPKATFFPNVYLSHYVHFSQGIECNFVASAISSSLTATALPCRRHGLSAPSDRVTESILLMSRRRTPSMPPTSEPDLFPSPKPTLCDFLSPTQIGRDGYNSFFFSFPERLSQPALYTLHYVHPLCMTRIS
jgi:hypothetical protein